MKEFVKYLLFVLILILTITVSYHYGKINGYQKSLEIIQQNTTQEETFTHTITNVIFDTVYQDKYIPYYEIDTVLLTDTITNTITDTLILTDTIYLPNEISIKDTTFSDTLNNQIINNQLHIQISGFQTSLDTLKLNTSITSIKQNPKWYERIVPSVGVGIGTNCKIGIFAGVGYQLLR